MAMIDLLGDDGCYSNDGGSIWVCPVYDNPDPVETSDATVDPSAVVPFSFGPGGGAGTTAANNGTQQQIKQQTQQCISQFNDTALGKFVNFWSMASPFIGPDRLGSTIEDVGGSALKYGVYTFFSTVGKTWTPTPFGSMSGVVAEGIHTIAKDVVLPVAVGSTGLQILAHAGCNTGARQDAGQMNPLPPGTISGNP
jgi:hypothetical protein